MKTEQQQVNNTRLAFIVIALLGATLALTSCGDKPDNELLILAAEDNYRQGVECAKQSEGTDLEIELSMWVHGFVGDAFEYYDTDEKIVAFRRCYGWARVTRMNIDERGLVSFVFWKDGKEYALDYVSIAEFLNTVENKN